MKTVLLRSVSHELRTPLNAITYFTGELLEESTSISEEEKEKLKIVSISAKLVLSLIDDLLDYSKMLAGVFKIQKSNCDIREIIENTYELVKFQACKKNITLKCRIDPSVPKLVYTDPVRFSQIVLNLLSNALKFTMKGHIEVCAIMCANNKLKCYVQDTGIGIPDNIKQKLFSEFNTSNVNNVNPQGSGLGLCISNILAKELGGKPIKASSTVGEGSVFQFSIHTAIQSNKIESYDLIETLENETTTYLNLDIYSVFEHPYFPEILIVDDNEFNRIILGSICEKYNMIYREASNGVEAIKEVIKQDSKGKPFKVIIMDCSMPELDGWETTQKILKMYQIGRLSIFPNIIGYSAFTSEEDKQLCIKSGMIEHMIKPSPPEKIISTIKKYLI